MLVGAVVVVDAAIVVLVGAVVVVDAAIVVLVETVVVVVLVDGSVVVLVDASVVVVVGETSGSVVTVVTVVVVVVVWMVDVVLLVVVVVVPPPHVHSSGWPGDTQVPGHAWSPFGAVLSHGSPASTVPSPHVNICGSESVVKRCATMCPVAITRLPNRRWARGAKMRPLNTE